MPQVETVDDIKDLQYRCEFRQALAAIEVLIPAASVEDLFRLKLCKAQTLFEMHMVPEAKSLMTEIKSSTPKESEAYFYVAGRIAYLDQDYERSEKLFKKLSVESESVTDYYRALVGLANTYYTLGRYPEIRALMPEFEELSDVVPTDSRLSYALLKATTYFVADGWVSEAQKLYYKVIQEAAKKHWTYFVIKSLYGLATIAQKQNNREALLSNLRLLRCYLDPEEAVFLAYLVNDKFKEDNFSVNSGLEFDQEFKRIGVDGKWIALHDKPLLYNFLELLNSMGRFVSKQEIAESLWPNQAYLAKSHDPRIFDIARRVRQMIESYDNQPVRLLSGRYGYKLAGPEPVDSGPEQPADSASNSKKTKINPRVKSEKHDEI